MEWLRWQSNPWGQEILRGLSWDVAWVAIGLGVAFVIAHSLLYFWRWRPGNTGAEARTDQHIAADRLPTRIPRHGLPARIFHWVMATAMIVLLLTGFLPILGVQFSWVTPHWIAGLVLVAAIFFHIIHASMRGLDSMWITRRDLVDGWLATRQVFGFSQPAPGKPGKNPFENKLFHHATALATLVVMVTGLLMMVRVDTPLWTRNPYLLTDEAWGWIYVLHGASSVAFITLIMTHLYFAIRPEKRWITLSMIVGWIPRDRYLQYYDPRRWLLPGVGAGGHYGERSQGARESAES